MQSVDTSKLIVTRSNDFAFGAYTADLSREEFLFIYFFVGLIRMEDTEFKQHEMDIVDLMSPLDIRQKDIYGFVDKATDNLSKLFVKIPRGQGSWRKKKIFNYIDYISPQDSETGRARLMIRFDDDMKPYILQLKRRFGSDPFEEFRNLKANKCSTYTMEIFDMVCIRYQERKQREIYMDLDDLRKSLGLEKKYPNYHDFKKNVLDKAERECQAHTSLPFTFEPKKKGRRVVGVYFLIKKKNPKQRMSQQKKVADPQAKFSSPLVSELKQVGFNGDIETIIAEHGEQNIRLVLEYARAKEKEQDQTDRKIRSLPAFVGHLIKNKYWQVIEKEHASKERKQKEATTKRQKENEQKAIQGLVKVVKNDFDKARDNHFLQVWQALDEADRQRVDEHIRKNTPRVALKGIGDWDNSKVVTIWRRTNLEELGGLSFPEPLTNIKAFASTNRDQYRQDHNADLWRATLERIEA